LKCKQCKFLVERENISLMSQMMGYTAECSQTGVLFSLEECNGWPLWCPLRENNNIEERMQA